jgi:hypothetical protein
VSETRTISIRAQIEEVKREIDMRRTVYPGQVRRGAMRQGVADEHMARMVAVLETLQRIARETGD